MKKSVVLLVCLLFVFCFASSVNAAAPYPSSSVITDLAWDSSSNIIRLADGSDTWPITWANDGNLYTAYGDGYGFEPFVPSKLSLGFARVEGNPPNINGFNIHSSDEQTGDGKAGKKASGMLMVNGVLYMWVRNADNNGHGCQLAWSDDHGLNWDWASWTFSEFGYCTFLNFGQNYAGSRDNYVYVYTPNRNSAYDPTDDFVLMRVPKGQINSRNSYEFFSGTAANPNWNSNINQRSSVFSNPGNALRSGISYNAALGRYFWWQENAAGGVDTRFEGGFGVYDAPEPWGPWTTVYYTDDWDVGPGETASFPTKWISSDGKTMYLVFSGDDHFSVRKATLTVVKTASAQLQYNSVTPCRVVDTRASQGGSGPITGGTQRNFVATGKSGVPPGSAKAAMFNIVAVNNTGGGYLTVFAYPESRPTASLLNYGVVPGLPAISNGVIVPICDTDVNTCTYDFSIYAYKTTDVVVDVMGYFSPSP